MWNCRLLIRTCTDDTYEHTGVGDTPARARDAALDEAAESAAEYGCSFTILEERYA